MIQKTGLILFDCLRNPILEDFLGSGILQREDSSDHFVGVVEFAFSEVVLVPEIRE